MTEIDPDATLVRESSRGDDRAFEILLVRHEEVVGKICARYLRTREDVEEAVQDTFLKAHRALPVMRCDNLGGWLARIARNVCIDRIRRDATRPTWVPILEPLHATVAEGPEDIVAGGDPRIDLAMSRLSRDHRVVVKLRFMDEMTHQEIATAMRKSAGQVKALVHRAKTRLRAEWAVA